MPERVTPGPKRRAARELCWFLAVETVCLVGAGVAVWQGAVRLSFILLLVPLQLGVLVLFFKSDFLLLAYLVALLPLTALELVPYGYMHYVMYGVVLGLIVFLRSTAFVGAGLGMPASSAPAWYRVPLIALGLCVGLSYLNARAHGWMSSYLSAYSLLAIQVLVLVWLVATVPRSIEQLRQLVYTAAVGYAIMCVAFPFVASQVAAGSGGKTLAVGSAFVNLNAVAAHAAVFAAVMAGAALDARRTLARVALLVVAFLLVLVLVYTKSRGAWLGFGLAFVYVIARTRSYWLILPAAAVLGVLLSMEVLHGALTSRVEATSPDDPSLLGRLLLWRYALVVFKTNWLFGVGMENFRVVKQFYGWPEPSAYAVRFNAHNLLLEFLADLGIAGTSCFLWLVGGTFVGVERIIRASAPSKRTWLAVGLNAGLIAFLVHGLFDCIIWQHGAFMILGLLLGLCLCLRRLEHLPASGTDSALASSVSG